MALADAVWLSVEPLDPRHARITRQFPDGWSIYYVGSHEGCGCGFHSDPDWPDPNDGYDAASRRALADYLLDAFRRDPSTELALYDCWEGGEEEPIKERAHATPEALAAAPSPVPEGTYVTIVRAPRPQTPA